MLQNIIKMSKLNHLTIYILKVHFKMYTIVLLHIQVVKKFI